MSVLNFCCAENATLDSGSLTKGTMLVPRNLWPISDDLLNDTRFVPGNVTKGRELFFPVGPLVGDKLHIMVQR